MRHTMHITAALLLGAATFAAGGAPNGDEFPREGKNREAKDALEGQAPPALEATGWLNTGGAALDLAELRGKVVVLDFWGTW